MMTQSDILLRTLKIKTIVEPAHGLIDNVSRIANIVSETFAQKQKFSEY